MLVDRVLAIEGVPRSMKAGRIVTEHEVRPQAWYLDAGRIVPSIAIEAGQADLLLCGYLGIDFETRGLAVYRLLDATVTFHRAHCPAQGDVIRYDIHIDAFFRQGQTILFRFRLDATVDGEPFLSMRDGCAGFFHGGRAGGRPRDHPAARSISRLALVSSPRSRRSTWFLRSQSATGSRVSSRRFGRGDLAAAFGPPFDRL